MTDSTQQHIPAEAIEAVARKLFQSTTDETSPHLIAQAWVDGWYARAQYESMQQHKANPYKECAK